MATKDYIIAPSILSADFSRLGEEVDSVLRAGADWVHFDVMDNHYVPNLTIGPMVCQSLRDYGITAPIDVHLMVKPVDQLIKSFSKAGATYITFHPEASDDVDRSLDLIKDNGCKAGLVLNPDISIEVLDGFLDKLDMILLMSVFPGFGGQEFIDSVLDKVTKMRSIINENNLKTRLEIDGGIKLENIREVADAGADTFVSGSAIFGEPDYSEIIQKMRDSLKVE
ncbi:MAG TPA: ribulose-phosphate 3-epimerase [SAR86 cluster bacterium]|nr:ribulose-phosphate 3-epimerase [SAR86 cluster bacterium]